MSSLKKLMAIVLILAMMLGLVVAGYAASDSPSQVPDPANPGYDVENDIDIETTWGTEKTYQVFPKTGNSQLNTVTQDGMEYPKDNVTLNGGKDKDNNPVSLVYVGDGENSAFGNKTGQNVVKVTIESKKKVTIKKNAFSKSKVKKIVCKNQKTKIQKDAFKGTAQASVKMDFTKATKSTDIQVEAGSFNGLGKNAEIHVSWKMSWSEFKKLRTKLQKAGFKGKITRN